MAKGLNKAIVAGNLARDPEVRYTIDKRAWARFSVAANYSFKNKNGEYQDGVDFVPVAVWGALAESCGRYLKKGSPVVVEGRIQTRSYDAKDGSGKRYVTEVIANDVIFMGSRSDTSSSPYSAPPPFQTSSQSSSRPSSPYDFPDDGFGSSINDRGFSDSDPDMDSDFSPDFGGSSGRGGSSNEPESDIPF